MLRCAIVICFVYYFVEALGITKAARHSVVIRVISE